MKTPRNIIAIAASVLIPLAAATPALAEAPTSAVVVLHSTAGNKTTGIIRFEPLPEGKVHITGTVEGLNPDSEHAIHIHEYGDCTAPDATSAGGHYNPEKHEHGLPAQEMRHAGDFGNLKSNAEGIANFELTVDNISINGPQTPIIGHAVIVHAKLDDGGQPTGNAGARIACGVIGWANPGK